MHAADPPPRAVSTLVDAWPLFGLRIRSERLVLRLPTDDDLLVLLDLAKAGIHPPDEMPFGVAWSASPSPQFERGFLAHHWQCRAEWSVDKWQLNLLVEAEGRPVGSQTVASEAFPVHRIVNTGSWLGRAYQGRGLGKEMRSAVLALAFDGLGARFAESTAFLDNAASNAVSRGLGYEENGRGSLAHRGWRARRRTSGSARRGGTRGRVRRSRSRDWTCVETSSERDSILASLGPAAGADAYGAGLEPAAGPDAGPRA